MDFSRFRNVINEQQTVFDGIKDKLDAKAFDDICVELNKSLADISLVATVVPVDAKKELITILKSLRNLAVDLSDYRKKFDTPEEAEDKNVSNMLAEEVASESHEVVNETPVSENTSDISNEPTNGVNDLAGETQSLSNQNVKSLTLTNPNLPKNSNPFVMPNAA
jgi:hypothetical protein